MIGIDIGTRYIKLCQVEKRDNNYHIISALMAPTPARDSQDPLRQTELSRRIKTIAEKAFLSTALTATAIGGSQVFARNFSLPNLSGKELQGAVRLEAEQSISSDLSSMYSDFQVLPETAGNKKDILFVGVQKETIDQRMQIMRDAGLETEIIDIDNLALVNCYMTFDPNAAEESVILIDVGYNFSNITVIDGGKLRFVRNIDFGGKNITAEIAGTFGISVEIAEQIKKRPDLWVQSGLNMKNVLRRSMPDLLEALYRSIEFCMSRKKLVNLDKILLTGGSSGLRSLKSIISEVLGVHTEIWNPFDHIAIVNDSNKDLGRYMGIALGLALRNGTNV